jgi:hypothetical protein
VIDGFHRLEADPDWRSETLEHIKTPVQLALARIVANTHRRSVSKEERKLQLVTLAKELVKEGLPEENVIPSIVELTTFTEQYIYKMLPDNYKKRPGAGGPVKLSLTQFAGVVEALGALAEACEVSEKGGEIVVKPKTPLKSEQLLELRRNLAPLGGQYVPVEGQFVIPPSRKPRPRIEIVLNPNYDDRDRFAEDLDLWFLKPNESVALALTRYCHDKEMYWEDAVRHLLTRALKEEGYA